MSRESSLVDEARRAYTLRWWFDIASPMRRPPAQFRVIGACLSVSEYYELLVRTRSRWYSDGQDRNEGKKWN